MSEDNKNIYYKKGAKTYSINKDLLFARCPGEWRIARTLLALVLITSLHCETNEGFNEACQLRDERESFYNLI